MTEVFISIVFIVAFFIGRKSMERESKNIIIHQSKCQIKAKFIGNEKRFSSKLKKGTIYLIDVRLNSFGGIETNSLSNDGKWLNYWGNIKDFINDWDFN